MTYDEALAYIHGINWTFCKPGLERIRELCERLSHPERGLRFIHVAGTNGKGSFSSMTASILEAAGYKVGLYTSPFIYRFNERMRIGGVDIPDETLAEITSYVRPFADAMTDKPTEFELITAIAFEYFRRERCDAVVLECGMGGRLDSTNIISSPLLSVITGIALDHTAFLGDTTDKIAEEKAGIIKDRSPVLWGGEDTGAREVIRKAATQRKSAFYETDYSALKIQSASLDGTLFDYKDLQNVEIKLLGMYQPKNASLVLDAVRILNKRGLSISEDAVRAGLLRARWRARFEIIHTNPTVIFDGAHNPQGIDVAVESIKRYFHGQRVVVFTGVLRDKDYHIIAKRISEVASMAYTITPDNKRALTAEEYAKVLGGYGVKATPCADIPTALSSGIEAARAGNTALVCLGSLYTYVDVINAMNRS